MIERNKQLRSLPIAGLLLALFLLLGCSSDNNPVGGNDDDLDHLEAVGVQLRDGDTVLVEANGSELTGSIRLAVGDTTAWLSIWLLDADDNSWFDPGQHGEEGHEEEDVFEPELELVNGDLAEVEKGADHGHGHWELRLIGLQAGNTAFRLLTLHGEHPDYTSPLLPLVVTAP